MARQPLPDVPRGVTRTVKPGGKAYWYYDPARAKLPGKRRRLPELGTLDWFDEIEAIKREQSGEAPSTLDIRALVQDYKQSAGWRGLAENTVGSYNAALKQVIASWRYRRPSDIAACDVVALMERRAATPSMANMTLTVVKMLMDYAVQKGCRNDNPARGVRRLKEEKDGAKPLTEAVWAALMAPECPVPVYRLAILGRYTGQRISDLIRMRPSGRDEDGIKCTIKKLRYKPIWCFLTPEQAREVDGWGLSGDGAYIVKPNGGAHTADSLRYVWNKFTRSEAGAALRGYTPHDLRATKVCDERIAGKTHQQIAAMVGLSIQKVMHYSQHIDQRMVARGAEPARKPPETDSGPMGRIRDLAEAADYLRAPVDVIAALSRQLGLGARFGDAISFSEEDIRSLWEYSRLTPAS